MNCENINMKFVACLIIVTLFLGQNSAYYVFERDNVQIIGSVFTDDLIGEIPVYLPYSIGGYEIIDFPPVSSFEIEIDLNNHQPYCFRLQHMDQGIM